MIRYKLKCDNCKKSFDSWFSSSLEFEKLKNKKFLNCHFCDSNNISNINDIKLKDFDKAVNSVLLNLAKRVVSDGEGASKFIQIDVNKCKTEDDAKKIAFSIANSPLVKTAFAGEDPNWGRILMAAGKNDVEININSVSLMIGDYKVFEKGQVAKNYSESNLKEYMKNSSIKIVLDVNLGKKNFTCYTMDFTKKYIEINSDYRT